ncbi:MAG TPA: HAMP domain-containing sensor histidine kinase [Kofleriaceae bacterium]|nr:HAMP domain-containing sensor histidine kinase [Kofleriaceae bacterium]
MAGKLFLILLFVALAPLVVFSVTALRAHEQALVADRSELHHKTAESAARATAASLDAVHRTVAGLARTIPWSQLSPEERDGALVLVYEQLDDIAVVELVDASGAKVAGIAHDAKGQHPPAPEAFALAIPTGEPIAGAPAPVVPIAVPVVGPGGASWTLAVGLSLRGICADLAAASPPGIATRLVGAGDTPLCGGGAATGDELRASVTLDHGWTAIAEQPRAAALASLTQIRRQSMFWVGLGVLAAIAAGLALTQIIRRPLRALSIGAEAIARGELEHRVGIGGRDEFAALARTFNRMSGELDRKTTEIRAWNEDLQRRVDARTAELKDAQDQLLQSRKLAAMAALGAGVAHEINNPLAGVLGMTQLVLARADTLDERTARSLKTIEREALRVRDIVERMSDLAQESVRDAVRVDVAQVVEAAAAAHADRIAAGKVELERAFTAQPHVLANAAQLQHAVSQLVDNSLKAMPGGGKLRLAVRTIEDELVAIDVCDSGRGIAPDLLDKIFEPFFTTKDDWRGAGLGLTLAHRIVEAHQGRIRAHSTVGAGTTMTITLPIARRGAHLA